jgi:hypothetical protein
MATRKPKPTAAPVEPIETVEAAPEPTYPLTIPISRAALALSQLSAKEDTRPALATVWTGGGLYQAADGFVAGTVKPAMDEFAPPDGIMIPRRVAETAKGKTTRIKNGATLERTDELSGGITTDAKPAERIAYASPEGVTAPSIPDIAERTQAPQASVVLNAGLLKQVASFLATATEDTDEMVELRVWSVNKAIEFRTRTRDADEVMVLQMPMVMGGYGSTGHWLFDAPPGVKSPSDLLEHHISQAIRQGRAGFGPAAIEQIRADKPADAPEREEWSISEGRFVSLASPEELRRMDRKADAAQALELLGYSDDVIGRVTELLGEIAPAETEATAAD